MAIDTETKRRSMLGRSLMFLVIAPVPDGTLSSVDRLHIIGFPGTIAPGAPVVTTTALNYFCDAGTVADTPPNHVADSGNNLLIADSLEVQQDLYAGGETNYAKWIDGALTLAGTARVHRHIRIGAGSWKLGNTAPTRGITGCFPHLSFASGADEEATYLIMVPYRRAAGTDLTLQIFWYYTGGDDAADCEWNLSYCAVKAGEDPTGAGTAHAEVFTTIDHDDTVGVTEFTIPSAAIENHDDLGMRLWRDGSDALGTAAILLAAHLEFTMDKLGEAI